MWKVEVFDGTNWHDTNAFQTTRQSVDPWWHQNNYPWVHWATIGLSGQAKIRATRLPRPWGQPQLTSATILPSRYGITPVVTLNGGAHGIGLIEFTISMGQKVYVETNGQDHDTLYVFANPPTPASDPLTMEVYGPGEHNIGIGHIPTRRTVYLSHGAWVKGSLDLTDMNSSTTEMKVIGPGVLSGELTTWETVTAIGHWPNEVGYSMVYTREQNTIPPQNPPIPAQRHPVRIEGITIVRSPYYAFWLQRIDAYKRFTNVHILSAWTYNTDGFNVGENVMIDNCFVFNNDDKIHAEYVTKDSVTVIDCVFAGRATFLCGYGYFPSPKKGLAAVSGCDLVMQVGRTPFAAMVDGTSSAIVVENQVFRDIVIDGNVWNLFHLKIEDTGWGAANPAQGNIEGIRFENIRLNGVQSTLSVIEGLLDGTPNAVGTPERPIVFQNLVINGVRVTQQNYTNYFQIVGAATVVFL